MKKVFVAIAALIISMTLCSCGGDPVRLQCGDVEYVSDFPREETLRPSQPIMTDLEGVVNVKGIDSVLVGYVDGKEKFYNFYSANSGRLLAELFPKGQGPGEVYQAPTLVKMYADGDSLFADLVYRDIYMTLNITASIDLQKEVFTKQNIKRIYKEIRYMLPLDEGDTLMTFNDWENGRITRSIYSGDDVSMIAGLDGPQPEIRNIDVNTVGCIDAYIPSSGLVVEPMIRLNQINVYSPKDIKVRRTICVGNVLDDVREVDGRARRNRPSTYGGAQVVGDKVALLYHGLRNEDYMKNEGTSQLQIFDAEMKPVLRINLPVIANSFYIDESHHLYLFNANGETEKVWRYDISHCLRQNSQENRIKNNSNDI